MCVWGGVGWGVYICVCVCVRICACVCMTFDISHGKPCVRTRFCLLFSSTFWAGLLELYPLMEIQPTSLYVGDPFIGDPSLPEMHNTRLYLVPPL